MNRSLGSMVCVTVAAAAASTMLAAAGTPAPRPSAAAGQQTAAVGAGTGRTLFVTACKVCHGEEGVGNRAPALRGERLTADYVARTITHGRPGTLMPKFQGSLSAAEIDQLARYVVSLQERRTEWATLRGDAAAGRNLFFDEQASHGCRVCHTFKGEGGKVGPDLSTRLARQSAREIFQRIVVVPHRSADPSYLKLAITTTRGEQFVGIKTEAPEHEFHFYDTASLPPVLRVLPKRDIASTKRLNGSAMPSDYASRFSLKELLDLVAFLRTGARGTPAPVTLADVVQTR